MSGTRRSLGVLVSGAGTNLEALLRACRRTDFPAHVALVVSNRRAAPALRIAEQWRVPALTLPQSDFDGDSRMRDRAVIQRMRDAGVELVVCAGYDRILSDEFLAAYADAILNVHPSLLPAFSGGMDAVEQALAHGVKVTGCTVQMLEPGITDGGPIVLQAAVGVEPDDDADSLRMRIHREEWRLLPQAVELWCQGRLRRDRRIVRVLHADSATGPVVVGTPPVRLFGLPTASAPTSPRSRGAPPIPPAGRPPTTPPGAESA